MTHTYKTTHKRHNANHGLQFSIASLSIAGIIGCFMQHWVLGVVSILVLVVLTYYVSTLLNARATYLYLNKDCGIDVTFDEAKKYALYFTPNSTGHWVGAEHIGRFPKEQRRRALFAAIAQFDRKHGKPKV